MNSDGTNPVNISKNAAFDGWPVWSPDGKKVVYAHPAGANLELFSIDIDGKNNKQLTNEGASNSYASWSRDGKKIAFGHFNGAKSALKVMDADGTNVKTVIELPKAVNEGGRVSFKP